MVFQRIYIAEAPRVHVCGDMVCVDLVNEGLHGAYRPHVALAYAQALFKAASEAINNGGDVVEFPLERNGTS